MAEVTGTEFFGPLIAQLGIGGVTGFIVGYALKKILKFLVVMVGLFLATLLYLEYDGFIKINYERFEQLFNSMTGQVTQVGVPAYITANLPFAGSFIAGFLYGFKKG